MALKCATLLWRNQEIKLKVLQSVDLEIALIAGDEWQDFSYIGLFGPEVDAATTTAVNIVPPAHIQKR